LDLVEETASVDKRVLVTGHVHVKVRTEQREEIVSLPLETDEVVVERVTKNQPVSAIPPVRMEGGVTIIPIVEEIAVVERRLILKEEIRLSTRRIINQTAVPVTLRSEIAIVERGPAGTPKPPDQGANMSEAYTQTESWNDHGPHSSRTIAAFYETRADADNAVDALTSHGFSRAAIDIADADRADQHDPIADDQRQPGGFTGWLHGVFGSHDDTHHYSEGIRRGGVLVTVTATEAEADQIIDVLEGTAPVDLDERSSQWRENGGTPSERTAYAPAAVVPADIERDAARDVDADGETTIPLIEEEIQVGRREVGRGSVRVRSYIVERPVSEDVTLRDERVSVERRPVDRPIDAADADAFRDRTISMTETAEEAVIAKTARVREEVVIRKTVDHHTETVSDTVRRTEVEIDDDRHHDLRKSGT
jgi:uncharacterized protein (TIGR02271 family)